MLFQTMLIAKPRSQSYKMEAKKSKNNQNLVSLTDIPNSW